MSKFIAKYLVIIVFLILPIMSNSQTKFRKKQFTVGKEKMPYNILTPKDINKSKIAKYPLVLFLHGAGERGVDNKLQITHIKKLFEDIGNQTKYPCIVIAPQCPKNKRWVEVDWTADRHDIPKTESWAMHKVMQLLDYIIKKYPVDVNRIYVTGLSMGGYGTWDIISRYPKKFAAAIPICGGGDENMASKIKDIPIWAFHGGIDNIVPVQRSRNMISSIIAAGGNPKYIEYEGVKHGSWIKAYKEASLLEWLFSKKIE